MAVVGIIGQTGKSYVPGASVSLSHSIPAGLTDSGIVTMGDGKKYRLFTITQSGTLTFDSDQVDQGILADIWICGGGQGGITASYAGSGNPYKSGDGGKGGFAAYVPQKIIHATTLTSIIGAGGAANGQGGATSLDFGNFIIDAKATSTSNTAASPGGGTGSGGHAEYLSSRTLKDGTYGDGKSNKRPFSDTYFKLHCSGGGSGGFYWNTTGGRANGGAGGENGANGSQAEATTSSLPFGGAGGSGAGAGGNGATSSPNGGNATRYGCGGGGGGLHYLAPTLGTGGTGKQGVIYIRIAA